MSGAPVIRECGNDEPILTALNARWRPAEEEIEELSKLSEEYSFIQFLCEIFQKCTRTVLWKSPPDFQEDLEAIRRSIEASDSGKISRYEDMPKLSPKLYGESVCVDPHTPWIKSIIATGDCEHTQLVSNKNISTLSDSTGVLSLRNIVILIVLYVCNLEMGALN